MVFLYPKQISKVILALLGIFISLGLISGCTGKVPALSMEIGDCFNADKQLLSGQQSGAIVTKVSCETTHNSEVIGKHVFSQNSYSNLEDLAGSAEAICVNDFRKYYGKSYQETDYDLYPLFPNPKSWKAATDKYIICAALHLPPTNSPIKPVK